MTVDRMRQQLTWTFCACALIIWAGTQTWAFQDQADMPVGLAGILPAYAPDGLAEEDFKKLSESIDSTWKDWVIETGELVKNFYEAQGNTLEAQQASIQSLRVKLKTMEKSLQDARYSSIHNAIGSLYLKLYPEVDLADAILKSLTIDREAALRKRVAESQGRLATVVTQLRTEMNRVRGGDAWLSWAMTSQLQRFDVANADAVAAVNTVKEKLGKRESYSEEIKKFVSRQVFLDLEDALGSIQQVLNASEQKADETKLREELASLVNVVADYREEPSADKEAALKKQFDLVRIAAPDGGVILGEMFRRHYMNYNLRITVTEGLMNRIVGDARRESSGINQSAMGARIVGSQTSDVRVSVDVQPSTQNARFNINLNGVISTNTNAYAQQATIRTVGRHSVSAMKPVTFDGTTFRTEPAQIRVQANNQPVGATTSYSGGLFGKMADNIAMREANDRRGEANAYTQRSIQQEMSTELNSEVNTRFSNASMELQNKLYGPLREYGLYPDAMNFSSTSNSILISTRLSGETEIGGGLPGVVSNPPANGMLAQIHQSLLTNSTNRLDLGAAGKQEMTEGQLREMIKERLSRILDREVDLGSAAADDEGNTFVFDQSNPIRFIIENGEIVIRIRAGLKREGDNIPTQIITVPLVATVSGDKILLNRGNVGVKPVDRPSSVAEQVARANVMRQKIQSALPEKEFDAAFEIEQDGKKINMKITAIQAENGWLTIALQ